MSSDPTPPPPGDNSLASWQNYEMKAAEKDREADRETIDKMLDFQKQFVPPSNSPSFPLPDGPSLPIAGPPLSVILEDVVDPSPPPSIPVPPEAPSIADSSAVEVLPPPPEPAASPEGALASGSIQVSES
ncbi:hypothetical protein H0H93_015053, partial [Arthromyces matolae]